jgi:hypothetical protein
MMTVSYQKAKSPVTTYLLDYELDYDNDIGVAQVLLQSYSLDCRSSSIVRS